MKKELQNYIKSIKANTSEGVGFAGAFLFTLENVETGEVEKKFFHNVITKDGREMMMEHLLESAPSADMYVTEIALGTDATTVSEDDTDMTTETYRNDVTSHAQGSGATRNIGYVTGFFSQTECSGDYKEVGIFCGDVLFSHCNIDVSKTTVQKMTVDWVITFSKVTA